jgi:hypothetical protein
VPKVLESPKAEAPEEAPEEARDKPNGHSKAGWLVFVYVPSAFFSLKASWATSTAGLTLLTPTPYAVKMAFLDAVLRHRLIGDPEPFVRALTKASLRIGLPAHACVTEAILRIRQETRDVDRKLRPDLPPYRPNMALRQVVHFQGDLRFAFDRTTCTHGTAETLMRAAPAINYVGKRGSFVQFLECVHQSKLDSTFTAPVTNRTGQKSWGHRASLDDFGPQAHFEALNSFTPTQIKRDVHRKFVDTFVPLGIRNVGPGFVHYSIARSATL